MTTQQVGCAFSITRAHQRHTGIVLPA
jgi:hypothetical protein